LRDGSSTRDPKDPSEEQAREIVLNVITSQRHLRNSQDEMRCHASEQQARGPKDLEHAQVNRGQYDCPTTCKEEKVRADDLRVARCIVVFRELGGEPCGNGDFYQTEEDEKAKDGWMAHAADESNCLTAITD
jgi:hypothetical protein